MKNKDVTEVHVWLDNNFWSVSLIDSDENEDCIGGSESLLQAKELGIEYATELGVRCLVKDAITGNTIERVC